MEIYIFVYIQHINKTFKYIYVCMYEDSVIYFTYHTETPPENKIDDTSSTSEKVDVKLPEVSSTKDAQKGSTHTYFALTIHVFFSDT